MPRDIRGLADILKAAPCMDPEGIVIFHTKSGHLYKKTVEKDDQAKGQP